MNTWTIRDNIECARDDLNGILEAMDSGELHGETDLRIRLENVYHYLNFAWNTRHSPEHKVIECSHRDLLRWGKSPEGQAWAPLHRTSASSGRTTRI